MPPTILAFAGSTREASFNKKLIRIAADAASSAGAKVTLIDLRDYPMPLYDGDLEAKEGMPHAAAKLKKLMQESQGFLISSPEYNSSISGVLKNALDWASRKPGDQDLSAFTGKVAGLMSASPSGFGGLRGLVELKRLLGNIGVLVIPQQVSISAAHEAFAEDGSLKDARKTQQVEALAKALVETAGKLTA